MSQFFAASPGFALLKCNGERSSCPNCLELSKNPLPPSRGRNWFSQDSPADASLGTVQAAEWMKTSICQNAAKEQQKQPMFQTTLLPTAEDSITKQTLMAPSNTFPGSEFFMYGSAQCVMLPCSTFSTRATRKISTCGSVTEKTPCNRQTVGCQRAGHPTHTAGFGPNHLAVPSQNPHRPCSGCCCGWAMGAHKT